MYIETAIYGVFVKSWRSFFHFLPRVSCWLRFCFYRCPTVPRLSAGCTLETDPSDYCCKVAVCRQTTTPAPGQPTPPPTKPPSMTICFSTCALSSAKNDNIYSLLNWKFWPSEFSLSISHHHFVAFCVYKGVPYTQGQTWQDGCSTTCRCDDADNNLYNCFDR